MSSWPAPTRPDPQAEDQQGPQLELIAGSEVTTNVAGVANEAQARELATYRRQTTTAAQDASLKSARRGDPDNFDLAVQTIRRLTREGLEVTADDVRREVVIASNAVGAAFRFLAKRGEIRCVGYTTSTSPSRHGGLQRRWVAS